MDLEGGMGIEPLQHIHEIAIRVDPLQPARGEETLHKPDGACAHFRPATEPIAAAERYGADLPRQVIGIQRHGGIGEKDTQRSAAVQRIVGRLAKGIGR